MIFPLARIDISQGIIRYGSPLKDKPKNKAAFLTWATLITTLLYLLFSTALLLGKNYLKTYFAPKAPEIIHYLPFVLLLSYVVLLNVTFKAWYITLSRVLWPKHMSARHPQPPTS